MSGQIVFLIVLNKTLKDISWMNVVVYIPSHLNLYTLLKLKLLKGGFRSNAIEEPFWDP